ncbi:MAG: hypothetical protein LBD47_09680 [Treponema sp.]|jgi:hypothetical protein|nr:hypothetical protein [Treponema sp.]
MSDETDTQEPSLGAPQRRRPNAGYKLSKERTGGDQLNFHYSRDRRLEKAPQSVRDLYKEEPPRRFNLLRPLIGSKPRAMMFGSIVLICVTMLTLSVLGYTGDTYSLAGNSLFIQADNYDGAVMVTLKKTIKKNGLFAGDDAYTGAVDLAVSPANTGSNAVAPPVFYHRVFFSLESAEEYHFSVPFDSGELVMVLQTEKDTLSLKIKAREVQPAIPISK